MKLQPKYSHFLLEAIRFLFILLFVYAAVSKLIDYENFRVQLGQSPLLTAFAPWVAWGVPGSEIVIAGMLFIPRLRVAGFYAAFALMVMFTTYIIIILNFTDFIPCSCGGVLEKLGWTEHLIFNLVFVVLAGVGVFLVKRDSLYDADRRHLGSEVLAPKPLHIIIPLNLALLAIASVLIVSIIHLRAENLYQVNNDFYRKYPPHSTDPKFALDIKYNSYYVAGATKNKVYFGNSTAPLNMLSLDPENKDTASIKISINEPSGFKLRKTAKVSLLASYFFLTDGITPQLLRGTIDDWSAQTFMYDSIYFNDLKPMSPKSFALRTLSSATKENVLGKVFNSSPYVQLNNDVLEKQIDGIFCTDGMLHYNNHLNLIIYLYHYRNQYIALDTTLKIKYKGNTIDTNSIAKIKPVTLATKETNKMSAPPLLVNSKSFTYGNLLLVEANLMAENDNVDHFKEVTTIDVYNVPQNRYQFSFRIYPYKNKKLSDFILTDHYFIGLHHQFVVVYEIHTPTWKHLE